MDLDSIPDDVWNKLAWAAHTAVQKQLPVSSFVKKYFYHEIYEHYSQDVVSYEENVEGSPDLGWGDFVALWQQSSKKPLARALATEAAKPRKGPQPIAYGRARVQLGKGQDPAGARPWEVYNDFNGGDRFQFVVSSGGGIVLFNRMHTACQLYIKERCDGNPMRSEVHGWKVFGEKVGKGRSDSCVVYLTCPFKSPRVKDLAENYILPIVEDLVDHEFRPMGFFSIGDTPFWAMPLPDRTREMVVLGQLSKSSAGGLMSSILGLAFERAAPTEHVDDQEFIRVAKQKAVAINDALFPEP